MRKKPHIVLMNPDQWRGDVAGYLGNPAAVTPNLDRMVENDAVAFSQAYCQNPVCTPSRCSFMTGWYPHVRGHRTMFHMLRRDEPMLLRTLKEHGYFVWWGGKNDVVPAEDGFEPYCHVKYVPENPIRPNLHADQSWRGEPGSDDCYSFMAGRLDIPEGESVYYDSDWDIVSAAVDVIKNHADNRQLCLYLALQYPHPPYGVEEPWFSRIPREKLPDRIRPPEHWAGKPGILRGIYEQLGMHGWTEERWNELRATYYGMCSRVDHQVGLIVEALKEAGIYEDTAFFFFSDHGDFTGDYGLVEKTQNTFEDCLTRVPLVIKPPQGTHVKPGIRDALVELIDVPATVEDMAGIRPKHTHFGKSLLPLIAGDTNEHRDAVFCEGGRLTEEDHCKELESASEGAKSLYYPRLRLQCKDGVEHTKAVMCRTKRFKYVRRLYEPDELYDLQHDPQERNNLIDHPAYSETAAAMRDRLLTFYLETGDVVPFDANKR